MWLIIALVAVPIIEIALFIELGGWLGLWPTIGLVIFTAVLGGVLLRAQGVAAIGRLQASLAEGGDPRGPMADGAMILVAGLLMLTPGFFTDAVGFSFLIPPVRSAIKAWLGPRLAARATLHASAGFQQARRPAQPEGDAPIEADYVDLDDVDATETPPRPGGSGWSRPPE
ncbi:MAG: FxsA family protein [Pseudomonadota bacterium]